MKIWIIILMLAACQAVVGQDLKEQFDQFKFQHEKNFERSKIKQDSIFAKSIIANWKRYDLSPEETKENHVPKPEKHPKIDESFKLKNVKHTPIESEPKLMRTFNPAISLEKHSALLNKKASFNFYGELIDQFYSDDFFDLNETSINAKEDLSDFWIRMSKTNYTSVISLLLTKKEDLNLPDFGYILLIRSFLNTAGLSPSKQTLYSWFILQKSGYKVRAGLIDNIPVLVIASRVKVYGFKYYEEEGLFYYLLTDQEGDFKSYFKNGVGSENILDFTVNGEVHLPLNPISVNLKFKNRDGTEQHAQIYYNSNFTDLLADFPQVALPVYLNSSSSDLLHRSLIKTLSPTLDKLNDRDRVKYLLEFVQSEFDYRADAYQFGREKVMYPEEFLAYPFSDCDDRVVFLAYLIRTFTELPMIVAEFPQHVALGVRLPIEAYGESVEYKGYTFTLCDPTYLGAPLGAVISTADRSKIRVIEF
jgi:hypothetical protein